MDTLFVHPRIGRAAAEFLGRKHLYTEVKSVVMAL
jgi:hypothetical protein